jgi:hypothetical protein
VAGPLTPPLLSGSGNAAAPRVDAETAYQIKLRTEMGLVNTVPQIQAIRSAFPSTATLLGIPLTPDERAQLAARQALTTAAAPVLAAARGLASYGGAWFEQSGTGTIHLLFKIGTRPQDIAPATQLLKPDLAIKIAYVPKSEAELEELQNRIHNDHAKWKSKGVAVSSIEIDDSGNQVRVMVLPSKHRVADDAKAMSDAYADEPVFTGLGSPIMERVDSGGPRDIKSGPLYGGEWIRAGYGPCTAGYAYVLRSSKYYEATAGHCGYINTDVNQGYDPSAGPKLGTIVADTYPYNGGSTACDCAIIGPLPSGLQTNKVLVNTPNPPYQYTHEATVIQGESTCHTGAQSYSDYGHIMCGTVSSARVVFYSTTRNGAQWSCTDCFKTSNQSDFGDSGAPFGDGTAFLGLLSGGDLPGYTYPSKSTEIGPITTYVPAF